MYRIPLIRPFLPVRARELIAEVLDSGFLTEGPKTRAFEQAVAQYVDAPHALATTSCTTGLELALRAAGTGPGDEVIVPDYTYPATAAAVAIVGATPVLADVDPLTLTLDLDSAASVAGPATRAVLPVSLFGNPLDYDALEAFARSRGLLVIEDAACSLGASYKGRRVGALADAAVFSFHPRKCLTTGEGGMVTTRREDWAAFMDSYKHFGLSREASREGACFARIGTNYKLSDVLAALGLAQMEIIDELVARRRTLAGRYCELLRNVPGVTLPRTPEGGEHSYQTFCVLVEERDRIMQGLRAQGIEAQIGSYALHRQPAFAPGNGARRAPELEGSRSAWERCLALPLSHTMRDEEQQQVAAALTALL